MNKPASMTVIIPKDLHRQFKMIAAKKDTNMTQLLIKAIEKIVKKDKEKK